MFSTYLLTVAKALGLISKAASAVFDEFIKSVLAAPVKYRTNLVDRNRDDILALT